MIKKKICMVGEFAVGKTSLTQRFVNNLFSEAYLTTVGVKIDSISIADTTLVIWDIAGKDALSPVNVNYLVGASGVVVVVDCSREETVHGLNAVLETVRNKLETVPIVIALNKSDLVDHERLCFLQQRCQESALPVVVTSAKNDSNIHPVFELLLDVMKKR